jgi:predicted DNA-binding transcriptional regulator YafY
VKWRNVIGMRASRLVQLLLVLQTRGRTTAAALAAELEVTTRTIYRDVEALSAAGVPIYAESGHGGGIQLVDGYRTDLTGLSDDEARALALAGAPDAAAQLGLGSVLLAAQAKVDAALPAELRTRAGRLRERFLLDAPGWFREPERLAVLPALSAAVWDGWRIEIGYRRGDGEVTRRLEPLGLVLKAGVWYLLAAAAGSSSVRTYRVSRVTALTTLDERAVRPPAFDLAAAWTAANARFDRDIRPLEVRALVATDQLWRVRHALHELAADEALASARPAEREGWSEVTIHAESVVVAHDELLRIGAGLEVLAPAELRSALAATGAALAANHGG